MNERRKTDAKVRSCRKGLSVGEEGRKSVKAVKKKSRAQLSFVPAPGTSSYCLYWSSIDAHQLCSIFLLDGHVQGSSLLPSLRSLVSMLIHCLAHWSSSPSPLVFALTVCPNRAFSSFIILVALVSRSLTRHTHLSRSPQMTCIGVSQ